MSAFLYVNVPWTSHPTRVARKIVTIVQEVSYYSSLRSPSRWRAINKLIISPLKSQLLLLKSPFPSLWIPILRLHKLTKSPHRLHNCAQSNPHHPCIWTCAYTMCINYMGLSDILIARNLLIIIFKMTISLYAPFSDTPLYHIEVDQLLSYNIPLQTKIQGISYTYIYIHVCVCT